MFLKFGSLVLLLVVDGVFSEERLPSLSTVDPVSTIQQIPRLRRSLLRKQYAPVQRLLSNTFRRSLLATEATCEWDADRKECSISIATMRSLLEGSDIEFAKTLLDGAECVEITNKKDCNKQKTCLWDEGFDECLYTDFCRGNEDSPCAKAIPVTCDFAEADTICPKLDSSKRCERKKQCIWYSEDGLCEAESDFIYFGIDNLEDKVAQVADSRTPSLRSEYAALQTADNFTWQSYLDYEPISTECPPDIEPLVCEYFDAYWSVAMGPQFYCAAKYESAASACSADALCRWKKRSAECVVDRSVSTSAASAAFAVLTDSMPDGQDKRIVEAIFACETIYEKGNCNGTCIWYTQTDECIVRSDHIATLETEAGKNTTDGLCTFLAVAGFSDCNNQFTKKNCQRTELCRWSTEGDCAPTNEFYVSAAADRDPKLKKRYQRVRKQCSSYSTKKKCLESTKAY